MSYILEALKKAEQQREIGHVPGIDSAHEPPQRGASRPWLWVLAAVLLVNAALLALLLWPTQEPVPAKSVPQTAFSPPPAAPPVAPLVVQEPVPAPAPVAPPADTLSPPTVAAPPLPPPPVRLQTREPAVSTPRPEPPPRALPRPAAAAAAAAPAEARYRELPVWPRIPEQLFSQLNAPLKLDVHVYSDRPRERFVLINLRKYREGEQLQEGPQLDEITPEGVILSFQGQSFRVQAQ